MLLGSFSFSWLAQRLCPQACVLLHLLCNCCAFCRFAIQEAILTLVRLHQTFTFQLDTSKHPPGSSLEYVSGITLMPKDGIWLQPMKRDV